MVLLEGSLYSGQIDEQTYNDEMAKAQHAMSEGQKVYNTELERTQQIQAENAEGEARARLGAIQTNPFLSEDQKAQQSIGPLGTMLMANARAQQADQAVAANPATTDEARAQALERVNKLTEDQVNLEKQLAAAQGNNSFITNLAAAVTHLEDMNNLTKEVAQTFSGVFNAAVTSISGNLTKVIDGTESWHKALINIGMTIANDLIGGIIEMGVRWIMTQVMMEVFGNTLKAAALATATAEAASLAGIWWTPAVLSTIASAGTTALDASALVAGALVGFAEGGRPEPGQPAIVGEKGWELFVPDTAGTVFSHDQSRAMMDNGRSQDAGGARTPDVQVHHFVVYNDQQLYEKLKSSTARRFS